MAQNGINGNKTSAPPSNALSRQALMYMLLLALQFGMQPILIKRYTPKNVCRSTVVMMQETLKFCLALFMLLSSGARKKSLSAWSIHSWIRIAGIPAGLYCIQNLAALLAYQNLDAVTFNVLNQTKTLSAALCCYLLMGRKQSRLQVFALFLLLGAALVIEKIVSLDFIGSLISNENTATRKLINYQGDSQEAEMTTRHLTHGVMPVLLASFLSGLAGAISQKNLQSGTSGGRNPYLFSMELCAASMIFLTASLVLSEDGISIRKYGFFNEWTLETMIPIFTNAVGGILVGLVTKYAGSVRKGFALIFGIFLSGLLQATLANDGRNTGPAVSREQIVGGALAAISLWMHTTNPYIARGTVSSSAAMSTNGIDTAPSKRIKKVRKED